ncbi:MAG: hypothetical protein J6N45_01210 [Alphaproteobacteria bacterium]|nr:hypothetical protein [Alphaproteobacteria bacterium]
MAQQNGQTRLWLVGGVPAGNDDGIGANCQVLEYEEDGKTRRIMIDAGLKLSSGKKKNDEQNEEHIEENAVYDAYMPDFRMFLPSPDGQKAQYPLDAVFITHSHADHLDELIYMTLYAHEHKLKMPPMFGSEYTKNRFYSLLRQHHLPKGSFPQFKILTPYRDEKIKELKVGSLPVSHPTVGSYGYLVSTPSEVGYLNPGDNRVLASLTGLSGDNPEEQKYLSEHNVTHIGADSTSTGMKENDDVFEDEFSFEDSCDAVREIYKSNKGARIITPLISRSIEHWLPSLVVAKEMGKKVFLDGHQMRESFVGWQNCEEIFYIDKRGHLQKTSNKNLEFLREQNVQIYSAEDFKDVVWNYDNIVNPNAETYNHDVDFGDQSIFVSGAFGEGYEKEEGDKVSGLVHMVRGTHRHFPLGRKCVIDGCQRLIEDVRFWQTVETYRGAARKGPKIYLNELSRAELEKNDVKDLLNMCHFVEKRQLSGHNKAMGLKQFVKNVMENCKNFFKFSARKGKKLQVIGLHGNEAQRENSARALQDDKRIEFHNFANGDVIELKPGYSKVIKHINVEEQRFLGLERAPGSGQIVLKSMNGLYQETDREDAVFSVLSPTGERVLTRQEKMLEAAQKLEDDTPSREGFAQKHNHGKRSAGKVISKGKNAGKQKLGKRDKSDKLSRKAKKKMNQEQRTAERQFKNSGYDGR